MEPSQVDPLASPILLPGQARAIRCGRGRATQHSQEFELMPSNEGADFIPCGLWASKDETTTVCDEFHTAGAAHGQDVEGGHTESSGAVVRWSGVDTVFRLSPREESSKELPENRCPLVST